MITEKNMKSYREIVVSFVAFILIPPFKLNNFDYK